MEHEKLKNLKSVMMKDKILESLKEILDESYLRDLPKYTERKKEYKDWLSVANEYDRERFPKEAPKQRIETVIILDKIDIYLNNYGIKDFVDYATYIYDEYINSEAVDIYIYILTKSKALLKLKFRNDKFSEANEYSLTRDISKTTNYGTHIEVNIYRRDNSEIIRFDNEERTFQFFQNLNRLRNR